MAELIVGAAIFMIGAVFGGALIRSGYYIGVAQAERDNDERI